MTDLEAITVETFSPLRGERFRVVPGDSPDFELELADVVDAGQEGARRRQFSLLFRGGPDPPLGQRIYRVEHDELGGLDIFLVPLGPDAVGQRYEAVFT